MFEKVRTVRFSPYAKGQGPIFTLHIYDGQETDSAGRFALGYELRSEGQSIFSATSRDGAFVWVHCAIDSDTAVRSIMTFLTLRPGDTDAEYFADYSAAQQDFAASHAEALSGEVESRFPER
jgi:hypothetical protein